MNPFVTFLLSYWKPIAIMAAISGAWIIGDIRGRADEKSYYEAQFAEAKAVAEKQREQMQKNIDQWATAYEAEKTKSSKILDDALKGAHNEYAKNPDYSRCHVGVEFLRAYRNVATGNSNPIGSKSGK